MWRKINQMTATVMSLIFDLLQLPSFFSISKYSTDLLEFMYFLGIRRLFVLRFKRDLIKIYKRFTLGLLEPLSTYRKYGSGRILFGFSHGITDIIGFLTKELVSPRDW